MTSYDKDTLQTLLIDPTYVDEAIRLLGENQTADELRVKGTRHHNDIGFSAAYGRTGTRLYEFVTGIQCSTGKKKWAPKSLAHPVANRVFGRYISNHGLNDAIELGRKISLIHWRQLESLTTATVSSLPAASGPKPEKKAPAKVTVRGAEIVRRSGKAVQVLWDSKKVWLPTSQISWDSSTDELTLPQWLADKKGICPKPAAVEVAEKTSTDGQGFNWESGEQEEVRQPAAGTWAATARMMAQCDDSGFDWDAWKDEMKEANS
jgi:hypothetical protein